jgi:hypothetical protein
MLVLMGCAAPAALEVSPATIAFGDVVISGSDRPEEGWAGLAEVSIRNSGESPIDVSIEDYDEVSILLYGFNGLPAPLDLGNIPPDVEYVLDVGIAGYVQGESDVPLEKAITLGAPGLAEPRVITVYYTPHRQN